MAAPANDLLAGAQRLRTGMQVYHTASFLFGIRISSTNAFRFAEDLEDKSLVFIDEAHSLADRYSEMSVRNRSLSNSLALIRKKGIILVIASVHESRVAMSLKGPIDTLIYPRPYKPLGVPRFPPWCYIRCSLIGPAPFQSGRLGDDYDVPRRLGRPRKKESPPISPLTIYNAAKLMDSWEKPDILAGIQTTAAEIKTSQRGAESPEERQTAQQKEDQASMMRFYQGLAQALNAGYKVPEAKNLEWKLVLNIARQGGWVGEDKEGLAVLRVTVPLTSQYRVPRADLMKHFRPRQESAE